MDVSHTATIGRSHRGLDNMRELQALLAQSTEEEPTNTEKDDVSDNSPSTSDVEDIDNETAMNTLYNLLNELGDLNRSNRRAAEVLAEKFSNLQAQVSKAEESIESGEEVDRLHNTPLPADPLSQVYSVGNSSVQTTIPDSPRSEATFHTPPTTTASSAHASLRLESPVTLPNAITSSRPPAPIMVESSAQTEITSSQIDDSFTKSDETEMENKTLRSDVAKLMHSVKEQQLMARDYESTLAKALAALRTAVFERHLEIEDVQRRYRELLDSELSLNQRLQTENEQLKHALSDVSSVIRSTLVVDDHFSSGNEPSSPSDISTS
ncbi:hypothetical protein COEREDRAFT_9233 [Coemansia reversa NRRL 1564]|uniref:Uncharacterized protein n=1 Tax=Coemansia reversa (strain ATCC 12441 / NRRL 1564) TaxID=763665 RepID=A0A2G5B966_COERN|nr:hypothetical protein COEREDRAFT_9233 [Coemansia reversa NRRL 1564]|eukprot:PIA15522.1 hypothetical protein COEREDRAFT_9233 [Coemansia reversa NRRL 1564]